MQMLVNDLLPRIGAETPAPVYLFCPGKAPRGRALSWEPYLAEQAVNKMVSAHVDPSLKDLAFAVCHADETPAGEVVEMAQTLPFLAERRVVAVHSAEHYQTDSQGKVLHRYLEDPNTATVLLLVAPGLDRRTKLFSLCQKNAVVVECPQLREPEARAWLIGEAKALGKRLTSAAANELIARKGTGLSDLRNALVQVCDYVGNEEEVLEEVVAAVCTDTTEEEVWALTDAIAASNVSEAVRILRHLQDLGKNEFEILGLINWLLKTAYCVATNTGNVKAFSAKQVSGLVRKLGMAKLRAAFALCMETELMLRTTGADRSLAIELLVIKLAAPRRRAAASASR